MREVVDQIATAGGSAEGNILRTTIFEAMESESASEIASDLQVRPRRESPRFGLSVTLSNNRDLAYEVVRGSWLHIPQRGDPTCGNRWGLSSSFDVHRVGGTFVSVPENVHPHKFRVRLVVLAGAVTSVVWELQGSAEVAIATAALVLQLVEMTRDPI